jgi:hypothetical protein
VKEELDMPLRVYARVPVWFGVIVIAATAAAIVLAPRTSPTSVPPPAAAETEARPAWQIALDAMDHALEAGNISGAEMAWRNAYGFAMRSRRWQALVAAGDGSLRIGERLPVNRPYRARAAEAWRAALFLARAQHSMDGVLSVAEGFGRLGDREGLSQVLRIADGLAAADPSDEARRRVQEVRNRLKPDAPAATLGDPILALFPDAAVGP